VRAKSAMAAAGWRLPRVRRMKDGNTVVSWTSKVRRPCHPEVV
jgi:hypothetical protein